MKSRLWKVAVGIGLVASVVSLLLPGIAGVSDLAYATCGLIGIGGVLVGPRWWQPEDRSPYRLQAIGIGLFLAASVIRATIGAGWVNSPNAADVIELAAEGFIIAMTLMLIARRSNNRDPTNTLDVAIATAAVGSLQWSFVVLPLVSGPDIRAGDRFVESAFAVVTLALFFAVTRLAIGPGARSVSFYLFAASAALNVALETYIALAVDSAAKGTSEAVVDTVVIAISCLAFCGMAASALHPSLKGLAERAVESAPTMTVWRMVAMAVATAVPPLTLLLKPDPSPAERFSTLAAWLVIAVLVVLRLSGLVRAWQRARDVERILSRTAASLASSTTSDAMYAAVKAALGQLVDLDTNRFSILRCEVARWRVVASHGAGAERCRDGEFELGEALGGHPAAEPGVIHGIAPDTTTGERVDFIFAPMRARDRTWGALVVSGRSLANDYLPEALGSLSTDLATTLETAELTAEMHRSRNERRFKTLIESSDDILAVVDDDGVTTMLSPAAGRYLAISDNDLAGRSIKDLILGADHRALDQLVKEAKQGENASRELRFMSAGARAVWFEVKARDLRHDDMIEGVVLTARDITDRKQSETIRANHEARLHGLIANSAEIIATLSYDGQFTYVGASIGHILGWQTTDLVGRPAAQFIHEDDQLAFRNALSRSTTTGHSVNVDVRLAQADGTWRTFATTCLDRIDDGSIHGFVLNAHDISEAVELRERLARQEEHDEETTLVNRRGFTAKLTASLAHAGGANQAVLVLDIDDLHTINDAAGYEAGDEVLRVFAERLRAVLRDEDTAARLGGDDFAVLLEDVRDTADAKMIAERIRQELNRPFVWNGAEVPVRVSMGMSLASDASERTANILMRNSEIAMYAAKSRGGAEVVHFEPAMLDGAFERLAIKSDLPRAIDNGEFELHYQPIVSLEDRSVLGFEALVRWRHPVRGMISPNAFIPLAEESGEIVPLGRFVLAQAIADLAHLRRQYSSDFYVSVNLSPQQLGDDAIAEILLDFSAKHGVTLDRIALELTETGVLEDQADIAHLERLRELGVQLAADDFGSGFASYSALATLPFTGVKIDMSLVRALTDRMSRSAAQVQSICEMARMSDLTVVAEGVEDEAQVATLLECGCRRAQGYLFSRPLPRPEIETLLDKTFGQVATSTR